MHRLLSIHVPSLYPPESQDMDVAPRLQTSALIALGLLYCGTAHRQMSEVLLAEIGRKPIDDRQTQSQPRVFERFFFLSFFLHSKLIFIFIRSSFFAI